MWLVFQQWPLAYSPGSLPTMGKDLASRLAGGSVAAIVGRPKAGMHFALDVVPVAACIGGQPDFMGQPP